MWNKVASDLAALLERSAFPALTEVAEYTSLRAAAATKPGAWVQAADAIVASSNLRNGIKDFGSRQDAKATAWNGTLFRAASKRNNPYGAWWFDAALVERWEKVYPATLPRQVRRQKIFEALRPMLAVCYDWNDFTELWKMAPAPGGIPAITGQGRAQPLTSLDPKVNYTPQERAELSKVVFIGGYQQVFLPFVPKGLVAQYLI
jgi:hypothetical protein